MARPNDPAHRATDAEIARLSRRVSAVYREAQKEIRAELTAFNRKFKVKDAAYRKKLKAGEITQEQYQAWLKGQVFQGRQWQAKLDQVTQTLTHADQVAQKIINGSVYGVFSNNANWMSYSLEHGAGLDFGFELYDPSTVARLLRDQPELLPMYRLDIPKDQRWNQHQITRQITQGIIQGEDIYKIADRMAKVTDRDKNLCLTRARTAMTGAQNAGRQESLTRANKMGIETEKEWLATLDGHTRTQHARLDGQHVPVDKMFRIDQYEIQYPGDPHAHPAMVYNCRCTMIGRIKKHPPRDAQRYDNIDGKPIADMTYMEWMEAKRSQSAVNKPVETVEKPLHFSGIRDKLSTGFVDHMIDILEHAENPHLRELYYKYGDRIRVVDADLKDGAYYSPRTGGIHFNAKQDQKGSFYEAPYQVAFHEFGHNIDALAGGNSYISMSYKNGALQKAIHSDFEAAIYAPYRERLKRRRAEVLEELPNATDIWLRRKLSEIRSFGGAVSSEDLKKFRHGEVSRSYLLKKYSGVIADFETEILEKPSRSQAAREFAAKLAAEHLDQKKVRAMSDIVDYCMQTDDYTHFGAAHGFDYWYSYTLDGLEDAGHGPREFFAEVLDGMATYKPALDQMRRIFPSAVRVVEEMLEELTK